MRRQLTSDRQEHMRITALRRRRELNLTQEEVAQRAGLGQSTIANMEAGRKSLSKLDNILALCRALKLTLEELTGVK